MKAFPAYGMGLGPILLMAFLAVRPASAWGQEVLRQGRFVMGSWLRITLFEPRPGSGGALLEQAFREVQNLDRELSHFRRDSGLSRLNERAGQGPQKVPAALFEVLQLSAHFSQLTEGGFDVTVGPLLERWKSAGWLGRLPDNLEDTLQSVGWPLVKFPGKNQVELLRSGMRLNLGGIGKGFAVDRVVRLFREAGVCCALINFGMSSFYALGHPPDAEAWNILVRGLQPNSFLGVIALRDRALSVSSAFGRSFLIEGKPYGHILNPRTGIPLMKPAVTVVVSRRATEAEALSTALLVISPQKGFSVVGELPGAEAIYTSEKGVLLSPCFQSDMEFHPDLLVEKGLVKQTTEKKEDAKSCTGE